MTENKRIHIWGAGRIGRGFIAELFAAGGYSLCFFDADSELVSRLKTSESYCVHKAFPDRSRSCVTIRGFEAVAISDTDAMRGEIAGANLIALTVFPQAFAAVAAQLAGEIIRLNEGDWSGLDIIVCTNIPDAAATFRTELYKHLPPGLHEFADTKVGIAGALVIRIAVDTQDSQSNSLDVTTNGYPELTVEKSGFRSSVPRLNGVLAVDDFRAHETRKLFTYNMVHATYSYIGYRKGFRALSEAIADCECKEAVTGALDESSRALQAEFGFSKDEMSAWNTEVLRNIHNPVLEDTLERLGSGPLRKCSPGDRLAGPAALCHKHGIFPWHLTRAIAAGFVFAPSGDTQARELQTRLSTDGIMCTAKAVCGFERTPELAQRTAGHYRDFLQNRQPQSSQKIAIIRHAWEAGFYFEKTCKGCAQCTLLALGHVTGAMSKELFQASSGLSGGMAICGEGSCGGYTAGILLTGSYDGRRLDRLDDGDKEAQYHSYAMAQKLHDRYIETYGAVTCREIHRVIFDHWFCLRTKPVRDQFEAAGAHTDKCTNVIAAASAWITEILIEEGLLDINTKQPAFEPKAQKAVLI